MNGRLSAEREARLSQETGGRNSGQGIHTDDDGECVSGGEGEAVDLDRERLAVTGTCR